jgi:hypothetical protein
LEDGVSTIEGTSLGGLFGLMLVAILIELIKGLFSALREAFSGNEREQPDGNHSGWSSISSFISTF